MAHNIKTNHDLVYNGSNADAGSHNVGGTPWHSKGIAMPTGTFTTDEVKAVAPHIFTPVVKVPVLARCPESGLIVESENDHFATIQNSNVLGTVKGKYRVLQNEDVMRLCDDLVNEKNGLRWETAGVLHGGVTFFACAHIPEVLQIVVNGKATDDISLPYLVLVNSHDGSGKKAFLTTVRTVCNNTVNAGIKDSKDNGFFRQFRATGEVRQKAIDALSTLVTIRESLATYNELINQLANRSPSSSEVETVLNQLFDYKKTDKEGNEKISVTVKNQYQTVLNLFEGRGQGANLPGSKGTYWGLLNAVTEFDDHHRVITDTSSKAESVLFGSGATRKQDALNLIREVAGVN